MAISNSFKLELIDLANTSGEPVLTWAYAEGGLDGEQTTEFFMKYQHQSELHAVPTLVRGLGPSLNTPNKLSDPSLHVELRGISGQSIVDDNDNWADGPNASLIGTLQLNPPDSSESAYEASLLNGVQSAKLKGADGYHSYGSKRGRTDIIRLFDTGFLVPQVIKSGAQSAWLSYDLSGDVSNNKVFAYSIEFLQQISGGSGAPLQSSGDYFTPSRFVFYSGFSYSGQCDLIRLLLDQTGISCTVPPQLDGEDALEVCLPSGLTSGEVRNRINGIIGDIRASQASQGFIQGDPIDDSAIRSDNFSLGYVVYQGLIEYNNPYSGDYFCVEPYSYDFTGDYNAVYGVNPPYPAATVCFRYGVDYTGISGLVSSINQKLSGSSQFLWNRDVCFERNGSGYFESGGLLKATQSGSNGIVLESLREGSMGRYRFTFYAADRPATGIEKENIVKYLLPTTVSLQYADTYGSWNTLDTHSNINWDRVTPRVAHEKIYELFTGFATGEDGRPIANDEETQISASGEVKRRLVYEAEISGKTKCATDFYKRVEFYEVPSGFQCKPTGDKDSFDTSGLGSTSSGIVTGVNEYPVDYYFLKTGWKFNNTTGHRYYRVLLEDFIVASKTRNVQLADNFHAREIVFYGAETGNQLLSGEMCIVGANYSAQVMGYTSGILTGTLYGQADGHGLFCVNKYLVTGRPNGNGLVRFQRRTGIAVGGFTGLVTQCATGTGYFVEPVRGYYYDSGNSCISFYANVSGYINGSGELQGGPYAIVNDSVIPTITETQIVAGTGVGMLTGVISRFSAYFENVSAFGYLTGVRSGIVSTGDFGSIKIEENLYGFPSDIYSVAVSGTTQATAALNYGTPNSGDAIYINETVIIYDTNPDNLAPSYFKTIDELTDIINDNSSIFGATGYNDGFTIFLTSIYGGESGNSIKVSTSGSPSFASSYFTGGINHYFPLTSAEPFSGRLDMEMFATGFFSVSGSGYLTGSIKQLDFVRTFTGLWTISSGDINYQSNNWITNGGAKYQNSGFAPLLPYSGRPDVIPLLITYTNSPLVLSNDVARLIVTGYGVTGLSMLLSGQI